MFCDNISADYLKNIIFFHTCTKHIEIDFHFKCEKVLNGTLHVEHTPTQEKTTDIMTNALSGPRFLEFRTMLLVLQRL